jgi:hypothetical protein
MRLIIFITDAVILVAMVMTIAYFFSLGYEHGRKESAKQIKKSASKPKNEAK